METILLVALYFLPTVIAAVRSHHNTTPIFLTNFFFGLTGVGWIIALIWSFTHVAPSPIAEAVSRGEPSLDANRIAQRSPRLRAHWDATMEFMKSDGGRLAFYFSTGALVVALLAIFAFARGSGIPADIQVSADDSDAISTPDTGPVVSAEDTEAMYLRCRNAISQAQSTAQLDQARSWEFDGRHATLIEGGLIRCGIRVVVSGGSGGAAAGTVVMVHGLDADVAAFPVLWARIEGGDGRVIEEAPTAGTLAEVERAASARREAQAAEEAERRAARTAAAEEAARARRGQHWGYRTAQSQMANFTNHYLSVRAERPLIDRYGGSIRPTLTIRCVENTTAFVVDAEEFLGVDDLLVEFRLDNEPSRTRSLNISTNREAIGMWTGGASIPFVSQLLTADAEYLTLRYTPYGENSRIVRFDVGGLGQRITPLRQACGW